MKATFSLNRINLSNEFGVIVPNCCLDFRVKFSFLKLIIP